MTHRSAFHFVTGPDAFLGVLAIAPSAHAANLREWVTQIADFRNPADLAAGDTRVEVHHGKSGGRLVRVYTWDDGAYVGMLVTHPDFESPAVEFLQAFLPN